MPDAECTLVMSFRPNVVNGWFLRAFARSYVGVSGDETECSWSGATYVAAKAGRIVVRSFIRYRGTAWRLGTGQLEFEARAGRMYEIEARNGVMNQTPFTPRLIVAAGGASTRR